MSLGSLGCSLMIGFSNADHDAIGRYPSFVYIIV